MQKAAEEESKRKAAEAKAVAEAEAAAAAKKAEAARLAALEEEKHQKEVEAAEAARKQREAEKKAAAEAAARAEAEALAAKEAEEARKAKAAGEAAEAARVAAAEKAKEEAKAKAEAAAAAAAAAEAERAKASLDRPELKDQAKAELGTDHHDDGDDEKDQPVPVLAEGHEAAIAARTEEQKKKDIEEAHKGEMGARLKKAGAKVGALTVSLMWHNLNDLDLHCESPTGSHIFYASRTGTCTGVLDVDANANEKHSTAEPIENILWHNPPKGHYRVWVEKSVRFYAYPIVHCLAMCTTHAFVS